MDLTRINLLKESNLTDLQDNNYLENLIIRLGFNTEILREQPKIVKDNGGGIINMAISKPIFKISLFIE
jgi:hypothetical protein